MTSIDPLQLQSLRFKYQDEIDSLPDCASHEWRGADGGAFRWVKDPMDGGSFLPTGKLPKRRVQCCTDLGLSLYQSEQQAKAAFDKVCAAYKNFYKTASHVAAGVLDAACGMCTAPDTEGHFDLHEFHTANVLARFSIKCPL